MTEPPTALRELAATLIAEDSVISPHVREPGSSEPRLGTLAAAGPRTAPAPGDYALVIESVREGYLLHYERGRVVVGTDRDLSLLAGDYLYALGLERLASIGDLAAVRELSDLISLAAQVHDGSRDGERARREADGLWLATAAAIAVDTAAHQEAKATLRAGDQGAAAALAAAARAAAGRAGIGDELDQAADSINFR